VSAAPLFLLDPPRLDGVRPGAELALDGPEGRHAATVRRLAAGEPVDVADGDGRVARCTVVAAGRDRLDLRVDVVEEQPAPALRFVLVQGLAKGGRDELAIEAATELGVDAVVPWQSGHAVVVWDADRTSRGLARWQSSVRAAAKQARRCRVPEVRPPARTEEVAEMVRAAALGVVLDGSAERSLIELVPPSAGDVVVVVGPEGGVTADELDVLVAAGAVAVRLGPHVLRASTAGPAALAVLSALFGRW
jgi:16S rRNA (uracil1498-N3)-methyltransferase